MSVGETAGQLRQGIGTWEEAKGSFDAGKTNTESILAEMREANTAIGGLITFFTGLKERVRDDVSGNYRAALEQYTAAGGTILSALESANNQTADTVREGIGYTTSFTEGSLEAADAAFSDEDALESTIAALQIAKNGAGSAYAFLTTAEQSAKSAEFFHPKTAEAAQAYVGQLESGA